MLLCGALPADRSLLRNPPPPPTPPSTPSKDRVDTARPAPPHTPRPPPAPPVPPALLRASPGLSLKRRRPFDLGGNRSLARSTPASELPLEPKMPPGDAERERRRRRGCSDPDVESSASSRRDNLRPSPLARTQASSLGEPAGKGCGAVTWGMSGPSSRRREAWGALRSCRSPVGARVVERRVGDADADRSSERIQLFVGWSGRGWGEGKEYFVFIILPPVETGLCLLD